MNPKLENPKRILLKLSWQALQGSQEFGIDVEFLNQLAQKLVYLSKQKQIQLVVVIGGWNIFRWAELAENWLDRAMGDYMGMMATVMNGIAICDAVEKYDQPVRVMSAIQIPRVAERFIKRRAEKHLRKSRVVLCVAGTGNPYNTTDSAAVLRALELNCDYMVKWTNVDGVYDKDPQVDSGAKMYDKLSLDKALKDEIRVMDQHAIAMAKEEWLPLFVCNIDKIDKVGGKDMVGTYVEDR